ncbi:MAG: adenylyl-sulfate kinase [Cyclobacteriaceae bacterium]|nr:adenylyl-sulfate kinase [Cyclobacteriaceae bacterium]
MEHIFPIFDSILTADEKQQLLKQRSLVIWLIGLSGSGKSTMARGLENALYQKGFITQLLDGDNLRSGINSNLGFSDEDRTENIRRAAEVASLFANCGIVTICSLITPTEKARDMAKQIIGEKYFEVFVSCPLEVCESRDVKGLYKKAREGQIKNFTGIDAPFEVPKHAALTIETDQNPIEFCHEQLLTAVLTKINY